MKLFSETYNKSRSPSGPYRRAALVVGLPSHVTTLTITPQQIIVQSSRSSGSLAPTTLLKRHRLRWLSGQFIKNSLSTLVADIEDRPRFEITFISFRHDFANSILNSRRPIIPKPSK
ncbi:hypothetical protein J6590_044224 [Homalodisca vitripennis]|nr:hypothetical protein J6590_044224 [Homalodisca vitripennis]